MLPLNANAVLAGQVAIVTGGGRGIGEAVAISLAKHGAKLLLIARTESELAEAATKIERLGAEVIVSKGDVSSAADVDRGVKAAIKQYGAIDILVNAAAIHGPLGQLWEADAEAWMMAVRVNLGGTFLCCRAVLPHMINKRRGKIVNFSGGGATSPSPYMSAYGVSKAAVVRLTETLATEVKPFNIQVNAIAPGMVDTRIHDDVLETTSLAAEVLQPIRRLRDTGQGGTAIEVPAELAVFLVSPRANGLSGKLISAPHDDWRTWDEERIAELMDQSWLALRRIDPHTVRQLTEPRNHD